VARWGIHARSLGNPPPRPSVGAIEERDSGRQVEDPIRRAAAALDERQLLAVGASAGSEEFHPAVVRLAPRAGEPGACILRVEARKEGNLVGAREERRAKGERPAGNRHRSGSVTGERRNAPVVRSAINGGQLIHRPRRDVRWCGLGRAAGEAGKQDDR